MPYSLEPEFDLPDDEPTDEEYIDQLIAHDVAFAGYVFMSDPGDGDEDDFDDEDYSYGDGLDDDDDDDFDSEPLEDEDDDGYGDDAELPSGVDMVYFYVICSLNG